MTSRVFLLFPASLPSYHYLVLLAALISHDTRAGERVFKCVDPSGQIEFTQTGCRSGRTESLVVKSPYIGWKKPVVRKPKAGATDREVFESRNREKTRTGNSQRTEKEGERCWRARKRLQRLQRKLRKGYKRGVGEKLRSNRDQLQEYLREFC